MTTRERQKRRRRRHGAAHKKIFVSLSVFVTLCIVGLLGIVGYIVAIAASAPSINSLEPINDGATSAVFAANGTRLGFIQADELRTPVPSSQIPQSLKDATVAIEDRRFYSHKGVDYEGVIRAAVENISSGKTVQGGSTITMQLVRNLYISRERTFERKIREAKLAQELEDAKDKNWILTKYINTVPYGTVGGQTAIGAQAAARTFFDKPVSKLTLPESALIAGLPQAPSEYNPFLDPKASLARRNDVLDEMAKAKMITAQEASEAKGAPLGAKRGSFYLERRENYFFDYVKQHLIDKYGLNTVRQGGLKIHTTINLGFQKAARAAIAGRLGQPGDPSSAIVSIDPANGYIRAMASSGNYGESKFNLAAQGHRQPGSTFKIMVLMTALRKGIDPASTTYTSKPLKLNDPQYGLIDVKTYDNTYGGSMDLVHATLKSDNSVYQQLDLDVGPDEVRRTAYDLGITTKLNAFPAEGLGGLTHGVSPLEMANAYATIENGGWRNKPIAVTKVVFPDGHTDDLGKPHRVKKFSDGVTHKAVEILEKNIQGGTGTAANIGCPAGGKTGTTDSFTDAWFVGFTPKLSSATWVGYPNARIEMTSVHGIAVAGGTFPAQIWGDYMRIAKGPFCSGFPAPKEPFEAKPFVGRYSSTGTKSDDDYTYTDASEEGGNSLEGAEKDKKNAEKKNGNGKKYDSKKYDSPPQPDPQVPKPKPDPPKTTPAQTTPAPAPTQPVETPNTGTGNATGDGKPN